MTWSLKDIGIAVILSYAVITILNYVVHSVFPSIPIIHSGIAILIFLVGIIISCIFVFVRDGSFDAQDVKGLLVVMGVVIAIYFAIRWALPDLFSIIPNGTKEIFSIFT